MLLHAQANSAKLEITYVLLIMTRRNLTLLRSCVKQPNVPHLAWIRPAIVTASNRNLIAEDFLVR